jgi:hypothetical protein
MLGMNRGLQSTGVVATAANNEEKQPTTVEVKQQKASRRLFSCSRKVIRPRGLCGGLKKQE